jgi:hypothetical protein
VRVSQQYANSCTSSIVNANKSTGELDLAQSEASVDGAATSPASAQPARAGLAPEPLPVASAAAVGQSFDTVPRPGSLPAIRADSSLENGDTKPPSNSKDAPASPASLEESLSTTSTLSPKQQKPAVFFPGAGVAPYIKPPVRIDYGTQLDIAPSTFVNRNLVILDTPVSSVRIGEDCLIGPNLSIYAVEHPIGSYALAHNAPSSFILCANSLIPFFCPFPPLLSDFVLFPHPRQATIGHI